MICQQICKCTFGDEQLTKLQDWLSLKSELTSFVPRLSSQELCRIPEKEEEKSVKSVFNDLSSTKGLVQLGPSLYCIDFSIVDGNLLLPP